MKHKSTLYSENLLRTLIEKMGIDILFECFAGMIIHSESLTIEEVHVVPKENHKRNYKNDIIPATYKKQFEPERYFEPNDLDLLTIYTSRSSILDYLPEDFCLEPDNTDEFLDDQGKIKSRDDIERYRENKLEQLKSAQRFFRPIEIEYNKTRIQKELDELNKIENGDKVLEAFWGDFPVKSDKWKRFIRTLHLTSFIIGDQEKTKTLIDFVLGTSVTLSFSVEEYCEMTEQERKALTGETNILGYNIAVGNVVYDYLNVCTLTVTDLSTSEFFQYYDEQADDRKLLDEMIKYYFPLDIEVRLDFSINPLKGGKEEKDAAPVLGYSSRLGD